MNVTFYYDRKDFMVGYVISKHYKYCQDYTCKEC